MGPSARHKPFGVPLRKRWGFSKWRNYLGFCLVFWIGGALTMVEPRGDLIVNLEEFAELCGVTAETMRVHVKAVDGDAAWLIERGARGRGYAIEAMGGLAWWKAKRRDDEAVDAERKAQLAQLRLELVGDQIEQTDQLGLTGKQRREEYRAGFEAIEYRKAIGKLVDRDDMIHALSVAASELRRRLMQVPAEFAIREGMTQQAVAPLEGMLARAIDEFLRMVAEESKIRVTADGEPDANA